MSKIQDFCHRYFKTRLTETQIEIINVIASGNKLLVYPKGTGVKFAQKVVRAYLRDGLKEDINKDKTI